MQRVLHAPLRIVCTSAAFLCAAPLAAHSPIMVCFENGDQTVTCEAGFSDGSSAAGATITVLSGAQRGLARGEVSTDGTFTFSMPDEPDFEIHLTSDSSHALTVFGDEIIPFEE